MYVCVCVYVCGTGVWQTISTYDFLAHLSGIVPCILHTFSVNFSEACLGSSVAAAGISGTCKDNRFVHLKGCEGIPPL